MYVKRGAIKKGYGVVIKNTFGMTVDEYKDYIAENWPAIFELLDGRVSFLGRGDKLFDDSTNYTNPIILIESPDAHYVDLSSDRHDTFQGGHIELYPPTTFNYHGIFVIYSKQGVKTIQCTESDIIKVLHNAI